MFQIEAAMKLEVELTSAHLWFEEIISGDSYEQIQEVWTALDQSLWYTHALLEGAENDEQLIIPLKNSLLREAMEDISLELEKFRSIAKIRYSNQQNSLPGSLIEQQFDQLFYNILERIEQVERLIQHKLKQELSLFQQWGFILLVVSAILAIIIILTFLSHEQRHAQQIDNLSQAQLEIQRKNTQLENMVQHDSLTTLPNRSYFSKELKQAISFANREKQLLILMFIDLDRFKLINDNYGHQNGDELLKLTAKRLSDVVRAEDIVARLSGDEFVLLIKHPGDHNTTINSANRIALKILEALAPAYKINEFSLFITASIGIALFPQDGKDADTLLNNADRAMYLVKNFGKNNFNFFSRALDEEANKRLHLEQDLHQALSRQQLELYYQPQYQLDNNTLYGLEALIRWVHPQYGVVEPGIFIPIAESCGLINKIDSWVWQTACQHLHDWQQQGIAPRRLSINLSALTFAKQDLAEQVTQRLLENQINPDSIELEITENVLMVNTNQTLKTLNSLHEKKLRIAIDDFGTGYSSLAYLSQFPFSTLKIDQGFISKVTTDKAVAIIVKTVIQMARELGHNIIAEGVETEQQKQFLQKYHCPYAQGFLFNKPMSKTEIDGLLITVN